MIDTHCHLDHKRYYDDLDQVILSAKSGGVKQFIIPGANPDDLKKAIEISNKYEEIFFAIGVHPYDIDKFDMGLFKENINHPKCVAIGECGLDYYRLPKDFDEQIEIKKKQQEIFKIQIDLAKQYNKPLIVHIREASSDSKKILQESNANKIGGVLHCFNADEQLLSLADDGFYFGIGGVITFKNGKKLTDILSKIPLEKLLIETDAPYLTPEPYRGKRNEPLYTTFVLNKICDILKFKEQIC